MREKIDYNTGEVVEESSIITYQMESEPEFVKIYLQDVSRLFNLPSGVSSIMYELLRYMTYENLIALTPYIRKQIADKLGTNTGVFNQGITKLTKQGLISKVGSGTYMANPDVFGKGKWKDIKNLRATIVYNSDGRKFTVERNLPTQLEIGFTIASAMK